MFIIELTYTAGLKEIDARMSEHMRWLRKHYSAGRFVMSGRKIPRDGGIIIATGGTREEMETLARQDPFVRHGLAGVRVIEFRASQRADDLDSRMQAEPAR